MSISSRLVPDCNHTGLPTAARTPRIRLFQPRVWRDIIVLSSNMFPSHTETHWNSDSFFTNLEFHNSQKPRNTSNVAWATAKGKHSSRLRPIFSPTRGYNLHTSFLRHDWIPVGNLRIMKITINHFPVDFLGRAHENVYVEYALNSFGELRQKLRET